MGSLIAGLDGLEGGTVEADDRWVVDAWKECAVVAEEEVVGVGGSEGLLRCSAEWELSFLPCNESFSFFFFFRKPPRLGIQDYRSDDEKGGRRLVASSDPFERFELAIV